MYDIMKREKLTDTQITERLKSLPEWQHSDGRLRREFATGNFLAGVELVNKITPLAEELNHHPDIHLTYPKVVVEIFTHDVGGITEFDFALAERIDSIAVK